MRIIIPAQFPSECVDKLEIAHCVHHDPSLAGRTEALIELVRDADAIIVRNLTQVRGALLDAMVQCRVIGRLGVGLDNIDTETCRERGITVIPAIGANARSVAEYVVTTAMMLRRKSYLCSGEVAAGNWPKHVMANGREIQGATLGIIGFGSIGRTVASLASNVGMRVIACGSIGNGKQHGQTDESVAIMSLDEVLAQSDIVTLHIPFNDKTRAMIGRDALAKMKVGSILINTARGGVVDEQAVVDALKRGALGGAAFDVYADEPLGPGSCFADAQQNLILTPHVAGVTLDSEKRVCALITDKVIEFLAS